MLDPALFRVPGVAGGYLVVLLVTAVAAANLFFTTVYAQQVLGLTPLRTGIAFLPNSVLVVVGCARGFLLDAVLAGFAAVLGLLLVRTGPPSR